MKLMPTLAGGDKAKIIRLGEERALATRGEYGYVVTVQRNLPYTATSYHPNGMVEATYGASPPDSFGTGIPYTFLPEELEVIG